MRWYLIVVLICTSLMANGTQLLSSCAYLFAICISSLPSYYLFVCLLLSFKYLDINTLDSSPLLDM